MRESVLRTSAVAMATILASTIALVPLPSEAACNLIPVAQASFGSDLGGVISPITAPDKTVTLFVRPCDDSIGFNINPTDNDVTLTFEPPTGIDTDVPVDPASLTVADCTLAGGTRCTTLTFDTPDTTTDFPPKGLAGPARIRVRDAVTMDLIAEVGRLYERSSACNRFPETIFEQFTVLPKPKNVKELIDGTETEVLATVDGTGSLLVPLDYWGDGVQSVLAEDPGAPVAIFLEGGAALPAQGAGDPNSILDVLSAQPSPSDFLRSFTLDGRPLPPLLRLTDFGSLFGSADAVESVIRIARNDGAGGPDLFDLSDRLDGGRGPVVISTFTVGRGDPIPLASLRASTESVAYARDEAREGANLNGDMDTDDFVVQIVDAATGAPIDTATALTVAEGANFLLDLPVTIAVGGDLVAFLESEDDQNVDENLDGDFDDDILRVYRRDGAELTAGVAANGLQATAETIFGRKPVVVSDDRVFFRGPGFLLQSLVDDVDGVDGLQDYVREIVVSPDGGNVYVLSEGESEIGVFARNPTTGELSFVEAEPVVIDASFKALGHNAGDMKISPDGDHLYLRSDTPVSELRVFARDGVSGALTLVQTLQDDVGGVDGLDGGGEIVVSPDGKHVYVASGSDPFDPPGTSDDSIAVFSRDAATGQLTFLELETEGLTADSRQHLLAMDEDGTTLISAGYEYLRFSRDTVTGQLTLTGQIALPESAYDVAIPPGIGLVALVSTGTEGDLFLEGGAAVDTGVEANHLLLRGDGSRFHVASTGGTAVVQATAPGTLVPEGTLEVIERRVYGSGGLDWVPSGHVDATALTPDGRHILVHAENALHVLRADAELRVFDAETSSLRPTSVPASRAAVGGRRALLLTPETAVGASLNGDGDLDDDVAQILDTSGPTDVLTPLGVAALDVAASDELMALILDTGEAAVFEPGVSTGIELVGLSGVTSIAVSGSTVLLETAGGTGFFVYRRDLGTLEPVDVVDGLAEFGENPSFSVDGSLVPFVLDEAGATDFNDDGDFTDGVMHVLDLATGTLVNTGVRADACIFIVCEPGVDFRADPHRRTVSFLTFEFADGKDLDGDGDMFDIVQNIFNLTSGRVQHVNINNNLGFSDTPALPEDLGGNATTIVQVNEALLGIDVDGDGVIGGIVFAFMTDSDGDGVFDDFDTCVEAFNPDELDGDGDGLGDSTCDPSPAACPPTPAIGCKQSGFGKSKLDVKLASDPAKNRLKWKWGKGDPTGIEEFGDPVDGLAEYSLCIYDASPSAQPLAKISVLPRGVCADKPCWKRSGQKGFKMKDKAGFPNGIQKTKLKAGTAGKAKLGVQGSGDLLPVPTLPLTLPVQVQLFAREGEMESCWEASYATAKKNEPGKLKLKGP
jgi:6-phosphogluconolactonase (cycloisomerase 2 family)